MVQVIQSLISLYHIPTVQRHGSVDDPVAFMQYVHDLVNAEGFVVCWPSGQRVKIKAHQYLQIHRAKEAILQDRNIVQLIIQQQLDDIKSHLIDSDHEKITEFEHAFNHCIMQVMHTVVYTITMIRQQKISRKDFATQHSNMLDPYTKAVCFKIFDTQGDLYTAALNQIHDVVLDNLSKTVKYDAVKASWFADVSYN
jgi:hypothetical protein